MRSAVAPKSARVELFFALTLLTSAALLFAVQPMFAKMVLPLLGGAPAVWNTCLVFYQAALLVGYLYAHLSLAWLGPRRQAAVHLAFLCLPWLVLPIGVARNWLPPADAFPVFWLWMLLSVSVGLPFLAISATAPMLQAWFSRTGSQASRDPYFLYAASNLGSLLALLGYPLAIESHWTLGEQAWGWTAGYGLLMLLIAGCAVLLWRSPVARRPSAVPSKSVAPPPTWRRRLRWLALSLVPSSLLLGVTTYISTDIAAIPLLWVVPLALYLLSFVLVFARRPPLPLGVMLRTQPYLIVTAAGALAWRPDQPAQLVLIGSLELAAFFVTAMVCHGQLAADRPPERHLTEFYLWMSLGGVLGGLLNALAAPLVFRGAVEYPLMLAATCLLRSSPREAARLRQLAAPVAILLVCGGVVWFLRLRFQPLQWSYADLPATKLLVIGSAVAAAFGLRRRPLPFALGAAALLAASSYYPCDRGFLLHAERSFFGVMRVMDVPLWNDHELLHGSTCHGTQSLDPRERHQPWAYYSREGPLGRIFEALPPCRSPREIGVLGLGAGAIAAYGQAGERITFYEIDPAVERIARNPQYFTYLGDCRAKLEVILGDARLSLVHGPRRKFDLLVLDVFSSDSVPIHLLTRQAMQIYLDRLTEHGLLAVHVSSRYLNLTPILGRLAADAGLQTKFAFDSFADGGARRFSSAWAVMARRAEDLAWFAAWEPLSSDGGRVWTDDFSDVVAALVHPQFSWDWFQAATWQVSPTDSEASFHSTVGTVLCQQQRWDEGIAHLRKALEVKPAYAEAHNDLGAALALRGFPDQALAEFEQAVAINPAYAQAHNNLGAALALRGFPDKALAEFERAVAIDPAYSEAQFNLAKALAERNRSEEAALHYQTAIELSPDYVEPQMNLAWLRATSPEAALRDAAQAVKLAERANRLSGGKRPEVLDALAAAYAAAGRFPEALAAARQALQLATQQNKRTLSEALPARIALYEAGKPYRQPAAGTAEGSAEP
jgi:tetratricopeptide (TPR) repeat protein